MRFLSILLSLSVALATQAAEKPNIIFILADDMGYGDCSINNPESKIPTPNIDRLAKAGVRFTDAHSAASVCTPSRYGLLTGTCPARTDISNFTAGRGPVIAPDEVTIADLLKDQGYATHMIGKWHLGFEGGKSAFDFSKPLTGGPVDCGFDTYYGVNKAPGSPPYFYIRGREPIAKPDGSIDGNEEKGKDRRKVYRKGEAAPGFKPEEVTEMLCREAVRIIREHGDSEKEQPFFLYYALTSPHSPWLPADKFEGRSEAGMYGDFIVQLDDEVGRVVKALEESGMEKDTLVIFSSDNGPMWRDEDKEKFGHHASGVFREHKASPYEGGHRVPFIATWPGKIAPGTLSDSTVNFTDFFATLAEMFDRDLQEEYPGMARDSFSFYPALLEPEKRIPRPPMIVGNYSLRMDDWKLVARKMGKKGGIPAVTDVRMFDLAEDLSEQTDLASARPERLQVMYDYYREFLESRELETEASAKPAGKQGKGGSPRQATQPAAKVEETLPPLKDGKAPQTLAEVWGDYDPEAEPMEVQTFKEWEEEGVVIRAVRYSIGTFKGRKAWMAGLYSFPKGAKDLPAVLQSHGGGGSASSRQCVEFGRRGYALFSLSWRVEPRYLANYELPPEAQTEWGGATGDQIAEVRGIKPSGELNLDAVPSGRNDGYFLRTLAARRGITFLAQQPEVDPDRIGMTGHSMGGVITHQTTAMEPSRLKASAPSDGPPIEHLHTTHQNTPRTEEDKEILELTRRTAVPALYADKVTVPMLFLNSINDFHGHAEDVEWIVDQLPGDTTYNLSRTPHANHWHSASADAAKFLWFDAHLKGTFVFPTVPQIQLDLKGPEGIPVATVSPDPESKLEIASVEVYYTRDGGNDFHYGYQSRIWHYAENRENKGSYTASIPVTRSEAPLWVYANVEYQLPGDAASYQFTAATETFLCSTRMPMVSVEDLMTSKVNMVPLESTPVIEDFGENWQKEWMLKTSHGYVSYKLHSPQLEIPETSKMVFKVVNESDQPGRAQLCIGDYYARFKLEPGENTVALLPGDFSTNDKKSTPSDWQEAMHQRARFCFKIDDHCRPLELAFARD